MEKAGKRLASGLARGAVVIVYILSAHKQHHEQKLGRRDEVRGFPHLGWWSIHTKLSSLKKTKRFTV